MRRNLCVLWNTEETWKFDKPWPSRCWLSNTTLLFFSMKLSIRSSFFAQCYENYFCSFQKVVVRPKMTPSTIVLDENWHSQTNISPLPLSSFFFNKVSVGAILHKQKSRNLIFFQSMRISYSLKKLRKMLLFKHLDGEIKTCLKKSTFIYSAKVSTEFFCWKSFDFLHCGSNLVFRTCQFFRTLDIFLWLDI